MSTKARRQKEHPKVPGASDKTKILVNTNHDSSILALKELVFEKLCIDALNVEPQPQESQSNGVVEN